MHPLLCPETEKRQITLPLCMANEDTLLPWGKVHSV